MNHNDIPVYDRPLSKIAISIAVGNKVNTTVVVVPTCLEDFPKTESYFLITNPLHVGILRLCGFAESIEGLTYIRALMLKPATGAHPEFIFKGIKP